MKGLVSSIRAKLCLVVIAGVVPAVMLASIASAWRETHRRVSDAESEFNAMADALAVTLSLPLSQDKPGDVTRALRAVGRMPGIRYARVLDTRGAVVTQFGAGIVLTSNSTTNDRLSGKPFTEIIRLRDHAFSVPVIAGGVSVGRLDLVADVSSVGSAFWSAIRAAVVSALAAAGLGLLIAMPILALVTEPLRTLAAAMRRVRQSADFSRVADPGACDETGVLVAAFNDMIDEIQARDAKLEGHRADLEQAVRDRTAELQIAKQSAEAANAAKTDFLAAMSHEIRTPMHGMLVTTELLQTTPLDDRQRRFAEMITKSGQSLLAIVNDILDLSKIEAGRMELERIPVQPAVIAEDAVQLFAARAEAKGIGLDMTSTSDVPEWIAADPVRLSQIISNLVGNAIKFTEEGRVSVDLSVAPRDAPDAGHLRLAVSDTGIGIEQANLERIFAAFEQAGQETSRRFGGTGIGLAISRRLAEAMGGTLTVESRTGEGSRFTCSIPAAAMDMRMTQPESPDAATVPSCEGMRVLAADDNPVNRVVLEASLARLGIEVLSVENGEQALDAFKAGRFDLVFMDCSMPVMDGYMATREIREFEARAGDARAATPIVALTAHVIGKGATAWQSAGMSDYLAKPFTLAALTEVVIRWRKAPGLETIGEALASEQPAHSDAAPTPADLLDFEVLDQIRQMDRDGKLLARLVRIFREQGDTLGPKLVAVLDAGDRSETGRLAHALKSMSVSIGARAVAEIVTELEAAANLGAPIDGAFVAAEFTRALEATFTALDEAVLSPQPNVKAIPKSA